MTWECQSVDQGRSGSLSSDGGVSCRSLGGNATLIWDYSYPQPIDEYYITTETKIGDSYCGSYTGNRVSGIVGSSYQGNRNCAFGVEIIIMHISGQSFKISMRTTSSPNI